MTGQGDWTRAIAIVREIGDLRGEELAAQIELRCAGEDMLRMAVEALLVEHDEDSVGIWDPIDEQLGLGFVGEDERAYPTVAGIEITGMLGRGGSGDVFAGHQATPGRDVAVKVMRSGLGSRRAAQRFDREARALAAIEHEAVASIYSVADAVLPGGTVAPCFVMERVQGSTLREMDKPVSVIEAARLLSRIARGLHAAHQRGVVHRDLKPSNVLLDENGCPKIIDFGVAMFAGTDSPMTMQTITGELLGTLGYMSPEQLEGSADVVDVRTDVYALGVMFYELVAGKPAVESGTGSSFATITAVARGSLPRLPGGGDADAVYRKATAHEARMRYDSAAAMADDLDRLVEDRPVSARAPSVLYAAKLFARRNPVPVVMGVVAVAAVVGLSVATTAGFVSASRQRDAARVAEQSASAERDAARIAERRAVEASDFLRDMLASPDPEADGPSVRVADLLDRSGRLVDERYADEPLVALDLHRTLGWTYASISEHDKAVTHFERALELGRSELAGDSEQMFELETYLADSLVYTGRHTEAVDIMREVVARSEGVDGLAYETSIAARVGLAEALRQAGAFEEASGVFAETLEDSAQLLGDTHPQTLAAISGLGRSYLDTSMAAAAQEQFGKLLDVYESTGQVGTYKWYIAHGNMGVALASGGEHEAAIEHYEAVLGPGGELMGRDHYTLQMVRSIIGDSYLAVGRADDAIAMGEVSIADSRRLNGDDHPDTFAAMGNHAVMLMETDRYDEALPICEAVNEGMTRTNGADHPHTMVALRNLAGALEGVGRTDESIALFYDLVERQTRVLGADAFDTILTENNLAFQLCSLERFDEAVGLMSGVVDRTGPESGFPMFVRAAFKRNLGRALLGVGDLDGAEAALRESISLDPENPTNVEKSGALLDDVIEARGDHAGG